MKVKEEQQQKPTPRKQEPKETVTERGKERRQELKEKGGRGVKEGYIT